jgi:16S rRNA (guanine966-N2)-methyltransferase
VSGQCEAERSTTYAAARITFYNPCPQAGLRPADTTNLSISKNPAGYHLAGSAPLPQPMPMRITGGQQGGRQIKVPKGLDVRPTPDIVKQAVFNSLGGRIQGVRLLELFAGSGALSLEALSRGAASATLVEKSKKTAVLLRENFLSVNIPPGHFDIRVQEAATALLQLAQAGAKFDMVIADPPYGEKNVNRRSSSFAQALLDDEHLPKVLKGDGMFILGHTKRDSLEVPPNWEELKRMKHGDTVMRFFRRTRAEDDSGVAA